MRAKGDYDPWFSNGAADVKHFFGYNPTEIYIPGEPASGNITGKVAGNVLTAQGTPAYQQAFTGGGDDPLGAGFTIGSTDAFDAANSGIHDFAGTSFAIFFTWLFLGEPTFTRTIIGKRSSTPPYYGFEMQVNATDVRFVVADASGVTYQDVSVDLSAATGSGNWGPNYDFIAIDETGGFKYHDTSLGNAAPQVKNSCATNPQLFSIGQNRLTPANMVLGPLCVWEAADNAENVITDRAISLSSWRAKAGI